MNLKKVFCPALLAALVSLQSGCHDYVTEYQEQLVESVRVRDGEHVDVFVEQVKYFSADPLEWAKQRGFRKGEAAFAKIIAGDTCYIVGPDIALNTGRGAKVSGVVSLRMVYEWPLEMFATFDGCLPVVGEVDPAPVQVIIDRRLLEGRPPSRRGT